MRNHARPAALKQATSRLAARLLSAQRSIGMKQSFRLWLYLNSQLERYLMQAASITDERGCVNYQHDARMQSCIRDQDGRMVMRGRKAVAVIDIWLYDAELHQGIRMGASWCGILLQEPQ